MYGWIEPFYEVAGKAIAPGQVWSDQPIYMPPTHGLKIERVDPQDDTNLKLTVVGRTLDTFNHAPIKSLGLESTEAAVVARSKRNRPVIILGGQSATEVRPRGTTLAETVMVVPVYGADQFDDHTRRRMAYYEFTNVFYLPASKEHGFAEGFARLDHVQPVKAAHLTNHRGFKLASDALDALIEWFMAFTTGRMPDDSLILDYRRDQLLGDSSS